MATVAVPHFAVPEVQHAHQQQAEPSFWDAIAKGFENLLCCGGSRLKVVPRKLLSFSPTDDPEPLPPGSWRTSPLDLDLLAGPTAVVDSDGSYWLRKLTDNSLHKWPVQLVPSGRSAMYTYSQAEKGIVVKRSCFMPVKALCAYSPLRCFPNPSNPRNHFLVWRLDDSLCFKLSHQSGWNSLPHHLYDELFNTYQRSSHVSLSGIINRLMQHGYETGAARDLGSSLIALYGGAKESRATDYFVYMTHTESPGEEVELDTKEYATEESGSLIEHPAVYPAINDSNEQAAIVLRLQCVNPAGTVPHQSVYASAKKFAEVFSPPTKLLPVLMEEVLEVQKTNTRARVERAIQNRDYFGAAEVSSFVKKEPYAAPKDPRNISNVCPEHNVEGFTFLLPIKEHLKTLSWYGPGRDPEAVVANINEAIYGPRLPANGTVEFVNNADGSPVLLEGDYSRYDGSQTEPVRRLAFGIMENWIVREHREQFKKIVDDQFAATARLPNGTKYYTQGSMLSGSWATTDGNTILNALVLYHALRKGGLGKRTAAKFVGVCFGDDGLVRELLINGKLLSELWQEAAADFNLKLECIKRTEGVAGYLSRYFEFGQAMIESSVPDLARLLPKFKQSVSTEDDPTQIFVKKYSALYYLCGDSTPVLSAYLQKWFALTRTQILTEFDDRDLPYWIQTLHDQGTIATSFLPCSERLSHWVVKEAAEALKISPEALRALEAAIADSATLPALRECYVHRDPPGVAELVTMHGNRFQEATKTIKFQGKSKGRPVAEALPHAK